MHGRALHCQSMRTQCVHRDTVRNPCMVRRARATSKCCYIEQGNADEIVADNKTAIVVFTISLFNITFFHQHSP